MKKKTIKKFEIEFSSSPDGDILVKEEGYPIRELTQDDTELINRIFENIRKNYTKAFDMLNELYAKSLPNYNYFRFLCVRRFIMCNFSNYDTFTADIIASQFNFEQVNCPLRNECKAYKVICNPEYNTNLTTQEKNILKMYCRPASIEEISSELFLSHFTIETHIKNIHRKLNTHSKAELIKASSNII